MWCYVILAKQNVAFRTSQQTPSQTEFSFLGTQVPNCRCPGHKFRTQRKSSFLRKQNRFDKSADTVTIKYLSQLFPTDEIDKFPQVEQIDLAPTLSLLLGIPVPLNSLGGVITELIEDLLPPREVLRGLQVNAHQLACALHKHVADVKSGKVAMHPLKTLHSC